MKNILVPIDFSPASRNAEEYAATLARMLALPLQLVHVYTQPAPTLEVIGGWGIDGASLQEENEEWVEEEIIFLKEKYDVEVSGGAVSGLKGDTLNLMARESDATLVVMGMKEAKRHKLVHSTVFTALRRTRKPVLVVPEGVAFQPIRNIVLAADFNEVRDPSCYDFLLALVAKLDAVLQVVHVAGKDAAIHPEELPGKLQLEKVLAPVTYWYHELDENNIEDSLLRFTKNHPADLLVMVAHHHRLFERLFGVLYTHDLSYKTAIPLLVLEDVEG